MTAASGKLYAKKVYMSSDAKLKTDVKDAPADIQLPDIKEFTWIDSSVKSYGVIAQDVEAAGLTELVSDDGDKKTVDYAALLCLMAKQLQEKVARLEAKIDQLER